MHLALFTLATNLCLSIAWTTRLTPSVRGFGPTINARTFDSSREFLLINRMTATSTADTVTISNNNNTVNGNVREVSLIDSNKVNTHHHVDDDDDLQRQTSTLRLLEHVNLNVPSQHEFMVPFYFNLLGCGIDPRKAANLRPDAEKQTLWVNAGASQFHLPYGDVGQVIHGEIGLCYDSLNNLKERINVENTKPESQRCFASAVVEHDEKTNQEVVKLVDRYGNHFVCRARPTLVEASWEQPIVHASQTDEWQEIASKYGRDKSECRGLDYVEFKCPFRTARKIAQFYEHVFDAPTTVVKQQIDNDDVDAGEIAIIGIGRINTSTGQADQTLLFREVSQQHSIPPYDGYHIALYVGETRADFEQAFKNAETAGVVWFNPRFDDKALDVTSAHMYKQFRLKDIIDLKSGEKLFELEHEIRSVEHSAWLGSTKAD